ncbi:MAG: uroporphyrinogen decarboxylase family protein [Planctomycetota bacterium]
MNGRERVRAIFARQEPDRAGFWLGNPHADTWPIYLAAFGQPDEEGVRRLLGDDFRWICPQWTSYRHPEGRPLWDVRRRGRSFESGAVFTGCEDVEEVEDFPWPDPDHIDATETIAALDAAGDVYRASGWWCPFFHDVADFMGMEEYFVKMLTHPRVVHAITRHVVDFYLEANRRFFAAAGDRMDGFFLGNDFGAQLDALIGGRQFEEFVRPYLKELVDQGRARGYQVILHSCGAVSRLLPSILDLGIDALHPLQARAAGMDAARLARDFRGRVAFLGGIDTQELLVRGTPEEVRAEVRRVKGLLGPHLVVSPSHEALLPNVPAANVQAMAAAAVEP